MKNLDINVQDLLSDDILKDYEPKGNYTNEVLEFFRINSISYTKQQMQGILLLNELGMSDLASYVINMKQYQTPFKLYKDIIQTMTLANKIKGTAKLKDILNANSSETNINMNEYQPKALSEREIK